MHKKLLLKFTNTVRLDTYFFKFIIMASSSKINLRDSNKIFLVGHISNQIIGSKLPSKKQVLSVLFFNKRKVNLNLRDSAK